MREAAIVATARTPIAKAGRGGFNDTDAPALAAHVVNAALDRAGIAPERIDDLIFGAGSQWGNQGFNIGRTTVFAAGLPDGVAGTSVDRKCASGLTALAFAARGIMAGDMDVAVAGGVESITHTRDYAPTHRARPLAVLDAKPHAYMAMIETAEIVAARYGISREAQDALAVESHLRAAAATDRRAPEHRREGRQHFGHPRHNRCGRRRHPC
jgi:acetyl-CoA C-acetyltransferase